MHSVRLYNFAKLGGRNPFLLMVVVWAIPNILRACMIFAYPDDMVMQIIAHLMLIVGMMGLMYYIFGMRLFDDMTRDVHAYVSMERIRNPHKFK